MKQVIVIVGPTGVGKTKLSIELAKKLDAEVINGDSVSIYKELNIGSAKPTLEELSEVKHHLVNVCSVVDYYSVYNYQQDVRKLLNTSNKKMIIVGGSGLYIKASLYDYVFAKEEKVSSYESLSNLEIISKIKAFNKDIEIPHLNNRQRLEGLLRKLENNEEFTTNKDRALYEFIIIGLTTDRNYLYERINKRVDDMFNNGLVEEVEALKDKYSKSRVLNTAIGYKEFIPYFNNSASIEEVKEKIKLNSRHYAKRQYTFFNNQLDVKWFTVNFDDFEKTIEDVLKFLQKENKKG